MLACDVNSFLFDGILLVLRIIIIKPSEENDRFPFLRHVRIQLPSFYPLELEDVSRDILQKKEKKKNMHDGIALFYPFIYSAIHIIRHRYNAERQSVDNRSLRT
jgi:hypothetical protein